MSESESRTPTDDPRVDAVLADLDRLADLPVGEHAHVYDTIHGRLRAVLLGEPDGQDPEHEA